MSKKVMKIDMDIADGKTVIICTPTHPTIRMFVKNGNLEVHADEKDACMIVGRSQRTVAAPRQRRQKPYVVRRPAQKSTSIQNGQKKVA